MTPVFTGKPRACFKIRLAPVFAKKAGWLGATSDASPQWAVTDVATTPDGLFRENSAVSLVTLHKTGALIILMQALETKTTV
jgi:hypothetical protein